MPNYTDLKVWGVNTLLISFTFTSVEYSLKIISIAIAIGYTLRRWYIMENQNKKGNNDNNSSVN